MVTHTTHDSASDRTENLASRVRSLLDERADDVPFHGWGHTGFVRNKAVEFAKTRDADVELVEAAALVHDLNYVVAPNSDPSAGQSVRSELLAASGFPTDKIDRIEEVIDGAHTEHREEHVDVETACLSDADTLYKVLPITPVLFAHKYLAENDVQLGDLARKIIREQADKLVHGYFFYDQKLTHRYRSWTEANLGLWEAILDSLSDPDVSQLVNNEASP